jgi:hypothetical protein
MQREILIESLVLVSLRGFLLQVGIAAGDSIESLMLRIGLPSAGLTASQMMTKGPKRVHLGENLSRSPQLPPSSLLLLIPIASI